jgi:ABC-2 type transport system permease protein
VEGERTPMKAIYILCLRQLKRYIRSPARIIGSLGQPILFLVALGFGFRAMFARAGGGNYINFLSPGIISMAILFNAVFSGIEIIWDRQFGFLKETLVAPVSRLEIVLGRMLGGAIVAMAQGVIVLVICVIAGFRIERSLLLPLAVVFMFLIALLFAGIGTVFGSVLQDMQGFPLIINFIIMPIFFFSGAIFSSAGLPRVLQIGLRLNPLSYGVDGLRGACSNVFAYGLTTDLLVVTVLTALLLAIGSYFFSKIQL